MAYDHEADVQAWQDEFELLSHAVADLSALVDSFNDASVNRAVLGKFSARDYDRGVYAYAVGIAESGETPTFDWYCDGRPETADA